MDDRPPAVVEAANTGTTTPDPAIEPASTIAAWQSRLLPFMMTGLAVIALLFFVGTFWNYVGLQSRLEMQEPDIGIALEKARAGNASPAYQDWYLRVVLEDRAMRGRHHQNTAVIESRTWTRFMGFVTGMMMVMCGCIFILGKLEAAFDGSIKTSGGEGAMKTSSPGLVLAVAGTVLIAISLSVNVNVEVTDRPVYLATVMQTEPGPDALPRPAALPLEQAASEGVATGRAPALPDSIADEVCKQAGKQAGCMKH